MSKPTIPVNVPQDEDIVGEGAERIRETRQAIYDLLPINPDDLDWEYTENSWPAGSLTGGVDPAVDNENPPTSDDFQDRAFLIGQNKLKWDYNIPEDHNAITPGPIDASDVTVDVPDGSTWTVVGSEDLNVQYLRDLEDVEVATAEDGEALIYNQTENTWTAAPAPAGPPGIVGPKGDKGETGDTGPQGEQGETGEKGNRGDAGPVGPQGSKGDKGDKGNTGADSDVPGPIGPIGPTGPQGPIGPEGEKGSPGEGFDYLGNVATKEDLPGWPNSYPGSDGDAYLTEDTGHMWAWGADDQWHDLGKVEGPEGPQGPQGEKGDEGEVGRKGETGDKGQKGDKGDAGEDGLAATIDVGTTTTVDDDEPAEVTNVGTDTAAIFDFDIPRGSRGFTGAEGQDGQKGDKGDEGQKGDPGDPSEVPGPIGPEGPPGPAGEIEDNSIYPRHFNVPGTMTYKGTFALIPDEDNPCGWSLYLFPYSW